MATAAAFPESRCQTSRRPEQGAADEVSGQGTAIQNVRKIHFHCSNTLGWRNENGTFTL
ncbi:hypothetical protein [Prevotella dentasini]